jgi:anti-sigma B factor antagonist
MTSTWEGPAVFGVTEATVPGARVLTVAGEVDLATVPDLEAALPLTGLPEQVVLDLSAVQFMDSSGLRFVLQRHLGLHGAGGRLLVVVPDGPVLRLIALAADGLLDVHPSRDAAFDAL